MQSPKEQDNTQQERLYNNEPNPEEIRYSEHKRPTNVESPVPIVLVSGWLKHRRGGLGVLCRRRSSR